MPPPIGRAGEVPGLHRLVGGLLYTAVTRARRLAVIVGSRAALRTAVRRADSRGRGSGLVERLGSAR